MASYEEKWKRERQRQARCEELLKKRELHEQRCARRKRKSCELVRELDAEAVQLFCGWANPRRLPSRF